MSKRMHGTLFKKFFLWPLLLFLCAICLQRCTEPKNSQVSDDSELEAVSNTAFDFDIVLIVIDTLRADHLPFYGYRVNTSPFLNDLSAESIVFEKAYAASFWTAPATASIFTSLYPIQHGVVTGMNAYKRLEKGGQSITLNRIPGRLSTMAEVLKSAGFKTYALTDNINICEKEGFDQGFDKFQMFEYISAAGVNERLREWEKDIKNGGRYFLYLHYMDPHNPYTHREPWFEKTNNERIDKILSYDSEINYVDKNIQEMFDLFGWRQETLVMVISDHGEEFFDHGNTGHGRTLYDETLRVPFMIYFPDGGIEGNRVQHNVGTIDILPTLRELIGLPLDTNNEGVSLVPLLGNREIGKRHLFSHLQRKKEEFEKSIALRAVVYGNWKYILSLSGSQELFDLENDPKEKSNKIDTEPEIAESLKTALLDFESNCTKYNQETITTALDEKTVDHLKSLGYLQ